MSIIERVKAFAEEEDILAEDFEAEFDNIAEAFNGLFAAGRVAASGNLTLSSSYQDVPGASLSITPTAPSLLLVLAVADLDISESGAIASAEGTAVLNVDGVDRSEEIRAGQAVLAAGGVRNTCSQGYAVSLTAAAHTVKLRARRQGTGAEGTCHSTNSGFLYLLIPQP